MFGTKHSKTNRFQKTIKYKTNEQNKSQNIHIEICKYKYNQVRLVIAVFASWVPNKRGVLIIAGVGTLRKIKEARRSGVGNFDKIKTKGLFVNQIQFYL